MTLKRDKTQDFQKKFMASLFKEETIVIDDDSPSEMVVRNKKRARDKTEPVADPRPAKNQGNPANARIVYQDIIISDLAPRCGAFPPALIDCDNPNYAGVYVNGVFIVMETKAARGFVRWLERNFTGDDVHKRLTLRGIFQIIGFNAAVSTMKRVVNSDTKAPYS
ncbi:hypothetical protein CGRA01v4_01341 [Colletotrichum graminicola]|nr:hypothetical protein CGRA01v4_01341 [Colletotrichum graminicola]